MDIKDGVKDGIKGVKTTFRNMKKFSEVIKRLHRLLMKLVQSIKMIIGLMKIIIAFLLSFPILLPVLIILLIVGSFILAFYTGKNFDLNKLNQKSIVINEEEINLLGIETDDKGKVVKCNNNVTNNNIIFTSPLDGYIETISNNVGTQKDLYQLCVYHELFKNYVSGKYDYSGIEEEISSLKTKLFNEKNQEVISSLKNELETKENNYNKIKSVLNRLGFISIDLNKFKNYKPDEYGYRGNFNFPYSVFNEDSLFINLMYNYTIGKNYSGVIGDFDRQIFGIGGSGTGNLLNELFDIKIDSEEYKDYFINNSKYNFIQKINGVSNYYNFNCPPCQGEGCNCTGNPSVDFGADFPDDNIAYKLVNRYIDFITDLQKKRVIYVSEKIKSPIRDYTLVSGKKCGVDISLMQRDGPSNLKFFGFKGYPKVNGVSTHAGLDIVGISDCDGKNTPIFPILEGEVVYKDYSLTTWGHTIIIKSYVGGQELFVRYSHLDKSSNFSVGDIVGIEDIIGLQGKSGVVTGEHLDLTIYTSNTFQYDKYLRNTLELGGLFNFTFIDLFSSDYSDYTIKSFTNRCSNCTQ